MPQRSEVVRVKRKAETADRQSQHAAVWFFCALSKQPLRQPVVACRMGRLYNKDAVYEYLLDPTSHGDGDRICPHVKKPRVCECASNSERAQRAIASV